MTSEGSIQTQTNNISYGIRLNYNYLKTIPGVLKISEIILGVTSVGCIASENHLENVEMFFLSIQTTFMMCTFCLLLSCIISWRGSQPVSETIFYLIYHAVAIVFVLAASITLVASLTNFHPLNYTAIMAASIIGMINTLLYFVSYNFAYTEFKGVHVQAGYYSSNTDFTPDFTSKLKTDTTTFERPLERYK